MRYHPLVIASVVIMDNHSCQFSRPNPFYLYESKGGHLIVENSIENETFKKQLDRDWSIRSLRSSQVGNGSPGMVMSHDVIDVQ